MAELLESPTIVLVGGWNPAILEPQWLARELFGISPPAELPVEMEFSPTPGAAPRFTLSGTTFIPAYDRLTIFPTDKSETALDIVEGKALQLLEKLPHTPVRAVGENFIFSASSPSRRLLELFNLEDQPSSLFDNYEELLATRLTSSLRLSHCVVNFTREFANGSVTLRFNFHYEAKSAADAHEKIRASFSRNLDLARKIANSYED